MGNIAALFRIANVALSVDKACDMFLGVTYKLQPRGYGILPLKENDNLHLQFSISKTEERWHSQRTAMIMDSLNVKKGFKKSEQQHLNGISSTQEQPAMLQAHSTNTVGTGSGKRHGVTSSAVPAQGQGLWQVQL